MSRGGGEGRTLRPSAARRVVLAKDTRSWCVPRRDESVRNRIFNVKIYKVYFLPRVLRL